MPCSFWWLYVTPLHSYATFFFFLLHSSVGRHEHYLSVLAGVNSTPVNICVQAFWAGGCMPSFILGKHLGVKWLGHLETYCWTFWGIVKLFSKEGRPSNCVRFPLLLSSLTLFIACVFLAGMKWLCDALICISLKSDTLNIFPCPDWPFVHLLWRNAYPSFPHF